MSDLKQRSVTFADKLNYGLLLGGFLFAFDTSMILLSRIPLPQRNLKLLLLLSILLLAIVLPFWITRRMFRSSFWQTSLHDAADRVWVTLFASTLQLLFEFFGLQVISPGKLVVTIVYGFICSLAAVIEFEKVPLKGPPGAENDFVPASDGSKLGDIRWRIWFTSIVLLVFGETINFFSRQPGVMGSTTIITMTIGLFAVTIASHYFFFVHARCPRCRAALSLLKREADCPACGLREETIPS